MYISRKLKVSETDKGKSLIANKEITNEEILMKFKGNIVSLPTKYTLQIDEGKHLEGIGEIDDYLNHSCNPNTYINFEDLTLRALKKIRKGEEVTFNYLTTEWDMANKFECMCGSNSCFNFIKGFKYLTKDERLKIKNLVSPFLKLKMTVFV